MLASKFYSNKVDPMPAFVCNGGEHGRGLLLSALAQPRQTFDGRYVYRTILDKGGALVVSLIENHPFIDGNKRMGIATLSLFLLLNRYSILTSAPETVQFALGIAQNNIGQHQAASWLRKRVVPVTDLLRLGRQPKAELEMAKSLSDFVEQLESLAEASS